MPKYIYQCSGCGETFEVIHSFKETIETCSQINECCECEPQSKVLRIPQHINFVSKHEHKERVGQVVDEYIKTTKEEVRSYKKEMKNWNPKK
jgi:hypothetical protein|tara:strand:- start:667 stop:942 length:276 start_codon:yes stop_codon:yes gene_type:complete